MGVRSYKDVARVYFDMDGVLAEYDQALEDSGLSHHDFKRRIGTYVCLPVMIGAKAAVKQVMDAGFDVWILTKYPRVNVHAASEKLQWTGIHFPELADRVILTPDKGCVGTSRDFLIDDHPEWANAHSFLGTVIRFERNWNDVLRRLMDASN